MFAKAGLCCPDDVAQSQEGKVAAAAAQKREQDAIQGRRAAAAHLETVTRSRDAAARERDAVMRQRNDLQSQLQTAQQVRLQQPKDIEAAVCSQSIQFSVRLADAAGLMASPAQAPRSALCSSLWHSALYACSCSTDWPAGRQSSDQPQILKALNQA